MILRILLLVGLLLAVPSPGAGQVAPTTQPHGTLPEGLSCMDCHSTEAWSPLREDASFDHGRDTGYSLEGRHDEVGCASCHASLSFDVGPTDPSDCASCHVDVHMGTTVRSCASCHTTASFQVLDPGIVHPADFPLEGAHFQTSCESCHVNDLRGAFTPLDRECASCHMGDYQMTPLVDHQALGFSTECTDCHSMLDFRDVAFDHFEISGGFELLGRHAGIECVSCHTGPGGAIPQIPAGPEDCVTCHLPDYQDEHGGSGFPTTCIMCHNMNDWDDATFEHAAATGFALPPDHQDLACADCHVGSSAETLYQPAGPDDCYACHQMDYDDVHAGTGFPTDCSACHRTNTWDGATFAHDFPITSGAHSRADCVDCHTTPGNYGAFSCLDCHEHRQTEMDDKHRERNGYVYASSACLSCHPDGRS